LFHCGHQYRFERISVFDSSRYCHSQRHVNCVLSPTGCRRLSHCGHPSNIPFFHTPVGISLMVKRWSSRLCCPHCGCPHGCGQSFGKLQGTLSTLWSFTRLWTLMPIFRKVPGLIIHKPLVHPLTKQKARRRVDHNVFSTPGLIVQLCSTLIGFNPCGVQPFRADGLGQIRSYRPYPVRQFALEL